MNEQERDWDSFTEKLDSFYAWPALYTFKFVVKSGQEEELRKMFPKHDHTARPSKNGNYTSVTFEGMMPNAQSVVDVYKKAAIIEGIIAL
jgi:putative lipoic acid-binding regulatory protein